MKTTDVRDEMRRIITSFQSDLATAASFSDPDLTSQALQARREEMRERAAASHLARATELKTQTAARAAATAKTADTYVLTLHSDGARSAEAWQHAILPRLQDGEQLHELLDELDFDGLCAVERFGPSWERKQSKQGGPVEQLQAEENVAELIGSLRSHKWRCIPGALGDQARSEAETSAVIAATVSAFASRLTGMRTPSDLTNASTFLNTVESPAFGGRFAQALQG